MNDELYKYEACIRIPTVQYGYVEVHVEGTPEEIEVAHNEFHRQFNGGSGLPETEFNAALDRYLVEGTGETNTYLAMNKEQQNIIQAIKRSKKRMDYKIKHNK